MQRAVLASRELLGRFASRWTRRQRAAHVLVLYLAQWGKQSQNATLLTGKHANVDPGIFCGLL
jgi:hypothetical protein